MEVERVGSGSDFMTLGSGMGTGWGVSGRARAKSSYRGGGLAGLLTKGLLCSDGRPAPGVLQNVGIPDRRSGDTSRLRRRTEGGGVGWLRVRAATGVGLGDLRLQNGGVPGLRVGPGRARPLARNDARPRVDLEPRKLLKVNIFNILFSRLLEFNPKKILFILK